MSTSAKKQQVTFRVVNVSVEGKPLDSGGTHRWQDCHDFEFHWLFDDFIIDSLPKSRFLDEAGKSVETLASAFTNRHCRRPFGYYMGRNVTLFGYNGLVASSNHVFMIGNTIGWGDDFFRFYVRQELSGVFANDCVTFEAEIEKPVIAEMAILLTLPGINIYGHWLIDFIPILYSLNKYAMIDDRTPILIPHGAPDWIYPFMQKMGVDQKRLLPMTRQGGRVTTLLVPSGFRCGYSLPRAYLQEAWSFFRGTFTDGLSALAADEAAALSIHQPTRIFISRRKWHTKRERELKNRSAVEQVFQHAGFAVIDPQDWSLEQQANLFFHARYIAGEDGSALHNIIFCNPMVEQTLIVLQGPSRVNFLHGVLGEILNYRTLYILSCESRSDHWVINTAFLESILLEIRDNSTLTDTNDFSSNETEHNTSDMNSSAIHAKSNVQQEIKFNYLKDVLANYCSDGVVPDESDLIQFCKQVGEIDHLVRNIHTYRIVSKLVSSLTPSIIKEVGDLSAMSGYMNATGISVSTVKGDLRYQFDSEQESCDLLLALEVVAHIKDQNHDNFRDLVNFNFSGIKSFATECYRVIRQNGWLFITTPNPCSYYSVRRILEHDEPMIFFPHPKEYSARKLIPIFEAAGFELQEHDSFYSYYYFKESHDGTVSRFFTELSASPQDRGDTAYYLFKRSS